MTSQATPPTYYNLSLGPPALLVNFMSYGHSEIHVFCVAAVKSLPALHHCVVIFFWYSGIMECTCMLFTFENGVPLMR